MTKKKDWEKVPPSDRATTEGWLFASVPNMHKADVVITKYLKAVPELQDASSSWYFGSFPNPKLKVGLIVFSVKDDLPNLRKILEDIANIIWQYGGQTAPDVYSPVIFDIVKNRTAPAQGFFERYGIH